MCVMLNPVNKRLINNFFLFWRLLIALCDTHICTLYSPRPVLEILVVFRKISTQCHQVSEQVIASAELRYKQWMNKTLRSRQRHNYLRMLNRLADGFVFTLWLGLWESDCMLLLLAFSGLSSKFKVNSVHVFLLTISELSVNPDFYSVVILK